MIQKLKQWLSSLSFRTGLICAGMAVAFYVLSFAQMLLPLSIAAKGALWATFFGLAKTAQYSAILIMGKEGIKRLRSRFSRRPG